MKKKPKKIETQKVTASMLWLVNCDNYRSIRVHVIVRNGLVLRGFAKLGTAQANCDPDQEDHVVTGVFCYDASKCKPAKRAKAKTGKAKR